MNKIGKLEAISLIVIIITTEIILNLPNNIIRQMGSGVLLNTVYISIAAVIFCLIICGLFNQFKGKDILDISEYLGGRILKTVIGLLYILFFLGISSLLVMYFSHCLKLIYFQQSPIIFILLFFIIPVVAINRIGFKAIARVNLIFVPILLISILVMAAAMYEFVTPQNLLPILGHGINMTFVAGLANIAAFSSIGYLYFLPPLLKNADDFKEISVTAIVISAVYLILTSTLLLMVFPYISSTDEMLSSYLITRLLRFGNFIERVDAVFIFIWIFATLCYLSITFFFILRILRKLLKLKKETELSYSIGSIVFGTSLLIQSVADVSFLEQSVYKYVVIGLIFILSFIVLLAANLKKHMRRGTSPQVTRAGEGTCPYR